MEEERKQSGEEERMDVVRMYGHSQSMLVYWWYVH